MKRWAMIGASLRDAGRVTVGCLYDCRLGGLGRCPRLVWDAPLGLGKNAGVWVGGGWWGAWGWFD